MPETNVERQLGIIIGKLEGIEDRLDRADDSRARLHESLNNVVMRTTYIETDMTALNRKVESVEKITDDVKTIRDQAVGAGTAGRWLIKIGIGVVTTAGWLAAAYTWMTGRPPP